MLDHNDPDTPPLPSPPKRKALFPVAPPSASSTSTAPLPSPMQRKHDNDREMKSRRFTVSDLTRVRLRRRIQKIYQMATDVIDGYGDEYYNKHDKPLPQETIDKIMLLYHHRIERRCIEVGLTVEEEEEWDIDDAKIDVDDLSESGEESEEHDSDDVNFYSEMDDDDDDEDDNEEAGDSSGRKGTLGDNDEFGDNENARQIAKWEQEIKSLRANLASDLAILQRMTHSPNRKNPYNKFAEWSAWKTNDVDKKVEELKVQIQQLKEGNEAEVSPLRKRGKNTANK